MTDQTNESFWDGYDIPIEFAVAQNNRIGQLQRGSTGTGRTRSTAVHFRVKESFEDGRLSRERGEYLCKGRGQYPDEMNALEPVTCNQCLSLMERWNHD